MSAVSLMLDTSVKIQHSESHKGRWQSFGVTKWGPHEIESGQLTSNFEPTTVKKSNGGDQIYALGTIAKLLKENQITAITTDALRIEYLMNHVKKSFNYGDFDLFSGMREQCISSLNLEPFLLDPQKGIDLLREYLSNCTEEPYKQIASEIGQGKITSDISQDAWHLHCCIKSKCNFFVTMDFTLLSLVKRVNSEDLRFKLQKMVVSPKQLCFSISAPEMTLEELQNYTSSASAFPIGS